MPELTKGINESSPLKKQLSVVFSLAVPAMLAQLSSIVMQYIDAAMVGRLGANASAAIGVVSSSMWLLFGVVSACSTGFSVQVAQCVGAGKIERSRQITRQAIMLVTAISVLLTIITALLSTILPKALGADESIAKDATEYFFIFALSLPFVMLVSLLSALLECSGNMKVPSILNALLCALDVVFNAICIFGFHLGVAGAALGTLLSEVVVTVLLFYFALVKTPALRFTQSENWKADQECVARALKIAVPMAFDQIALCGAQIVTTAIVAPLGTIALAANSFGVTAEAFCYMPAYGIGAAATTLVGQSAGAQKPQLAKRFAWLTVALGIAMMFLTGAIMYAASPAVFAFLTPNKDVCELGVKVLRIELFAEPLFGAYIVASGALRGVGDTLVSGIMNLVSLWGVRITLSFILARTMGLKGVWIAMCAELCFRGTLFLIRLSMQKWKKL